MTESKTLHYVAIIAAIMACATLSVAYAQVVTEPAKTWDPEIQRILNQLISVGFLIATGILSWVGMAIRSYFAQRGVLATEQIRDAQQSFFNQAAIITLGFFETIKSKTLNGDKIDWTKIGMDDPYLKIAAEWMMKAWPEATEKMSLEDVLHSLLARIPSGEMTERVFAITEAKAGNGAAKLT